MGVRKEFSLNCSGVEKTFFLFSNKGQGYFRPRNRSGKQKICFWDPVRAFLSVNTRVLNSSSWALSFSLGFGRHRISLPFPYLPPRRQDRAVSINCNPGLGFIELRVEIQKTSKKVA